MRPRPHAIPTPISMSFTIEPGIVIFLPRIIFLTNQLSSLVLPATESTISTSSDFHHDTPPLMQTFSAPPSVWGEVSTLASQSVSVTMTGPVATPIQTDASEHHSGIDKRHLAALAMTCFNLGLIAGTVVLLYKTNGYWRGLVNRYFKSTSLDGLWI